MPHGKGERPLPRPLGLDDVPSEKHSPHRNRQPHLEPPSGPGVGGGAPTAAGSCPALNHTAVLLRRCEPTPGPGMSGPKASVRLWSRGSAMARRCGHGHPDRAHGDPIPPRGFCRPSPQQRAASGPSLPLSRLACPPSWLQQVPRHHLLTVPPTWGTSPPATRGWDHT